MVQLWAHGVLFVRAVERNGDNSLFTLHEDRFVIRHFYCLLSKVHQIPLFPLYCRRDERGISGFFASLERLAKENFSNSFCQTFCTEDLQMQAAVTNDAFRHFAI